MSAPVLPPDSNRDIDLLERRIANLERRIAENPTPPPVGSIFIWAGAGVPPACLQCNGAAVSRTTYKLLFNVVGTIHGAGDGVTTFNLPNLANPSGTTKYVIIAGR